MNRVAVCSLRFAVGHVGHLRAYRDLFKSINCEVRLFLAVEYSKYIEEGDIVSYNSNSDIIDWNPDLVISYNIATENIKLASICKTKGIPFFYVLHEPLDSLNNLIQQGKRMPRRLMANIINYISAKKAYKVILVSRNGEKKYERYMKKCNKNYDVFPLIFCDDYDKEKSIERRYFSFIGGFTEMRACSSFLEFIEYSISKKNGISFVIATRSSIKNKLEKDVFQYAIQNGILTVHEGRDMSSEEVEKYYRESICVWNAYNDSTQSSVLTNALAQGTPVIVTPREETYRVITNNVEGVFVSSPREFEEVSAAFSYIKDNISTMENNAYNSFLRNYYYGSFYSLAEQVFEL